MKAKYPYEMRSERKAGFMSCIDSVDYDNAFRFYSHCSGKLPESGKQGSDMV